CASGEDDLWPLLERAKLLTSISLTNVKLDLDEGVRKLPPFVASLSLNKCMVSEEQIRALCGSLARLDSFTLVHCHGLREVESTVCTNSLRYINLFGMASLQGEVRLKGAPNLARVSIYYCNQV